MLRTFKLPLKTLLVALLLIPLTVFAGRQTELHNAEIAVMDGVSAKQAGEAVRRALNGRRWIITSDKSSAIEATQMSRGLIAKIRVTWDSKTVRITHVSSEGLSYEKSGETEYIHPNYNKWIANLERDIPVFMVREQAGQ